MKLAITAAVLFILGPLAAKLSVIPAVLGFGIFALGGVLGIVAVLSGTIAAIRGKGSWLAPVVGLLVATPFVTMGVQSRTYPPYNDFTTDMENPPQFEQPTADSTRDMSYPGGAVAEAQRRAYPDLQPLDLSLPASEAFALVQRVAHETPHWTIVVDDAEGLALQGVATTSVFQFRDDFVVRVRPRGGGSRIDMRSKSRDGRGDIGANAKRIRAFFAALAAAQ
jgi:uncharacterized protein (DUF1499 family)